jgi:hypothetical protein
MPEKKTLKKARRAKRQGKAPTTQAGAFVEEEIEHIREGKHGARSTKQAIAIGLSKARRSGVKLPPPPRNASERTKRSAKSAAKHKGKRPSASRSRAAKSALKKESRSAASRKALSRHAKQVAKRRPASARKASAKKAAKTRARHRR